MQRPENELLHTDIKPGLQHARRLLAYLLRATHVRIDPQRIGRERYRRVSTELADMLIAAVMSTRSTLGFYQAICARFGVDVSGGEHGPLEVWLPEGRIRWDRACAALKFEDVRQIVRESPDFLATFAATRGAEGDDIFAAFPEPTVSVGYIPKLPECLISPRSYRTVWMLTGPMHHGADTKTGNNNLFRRHAVTDPLTGLTHQVPFKSGNSIRGALRDAAMGLHLRLLGLKTTDIPPAKAHALLAGGAVEQGADTATVNNVVRRRARELCPPWDLFAGCIDQQIMQGRGRIGDATLVCKETAWKVHQAVAPDVPLREFATQLPSCDELTEFRQLVRNKHADIDDSDGVQMLVNFEVLREGSQMVHSFQLWSLDGVAPQTASFMTYLLKEFRDLGWNGAGFARDWGTIAFDEYKPGPGTPPLPPADVYLEYVESRRQEMIDWLMEERAPAAMPARQRGKGGKKERVQQDLPIAPDEEVSL